MLYTTVSALPRTPSGPDISQHTDHQPAPTEAVGKHLRGLHQFTVCEEASHLIFRDGRWLKACHASLSLLDQSM